VDLKRLVNHTAAIWQERARVAQVTLDVQVAGEIPAIRGDYYRLQQALDQLLDNALKFIDKKGQVTLRAEPHNHGVWLSISDTGIGIPREKLENIFERFYQVDGSRTRRRGGMGIGLALVRKIVSLHRGRIWAESDGIAGHGTTFRIALPAAAANQNPKST
jgi:signal transduction histidine kinase